MHFDAELFHREATNPLLTAGDWPYPINSVFNNNRVYKLTSTAGNWTIYGMYHCFNVVTDADGEAGAILVRALEPGDGVDQRVDGPGRLCRALEIDRSHNQLDLTAEGRGSLWIERRPGPPVDEIATAPRIGVAYAGEWAARPWRFFILNSRYMAKRATLITTNFQDVDPKTLRRMDPNAPKEFLLDRIGPRLRSRLMEMCLLIKMHGDDHREVTGQASNEAAVRGAPPPGTR